MRKTVTTKNNSGIDIEFPNKCPRCHTGILPTELFAFDYKDSKNARIAYVVFRCPVCEKLFSTEYLISERGDSLVTLRNYPTMHVAEDFSEEIKKLSPKFCQIYNEANFAENENLNEIAGMGYRKALEFLIKDFATRNNPDKKSAIEKSWIVQCIKDYIDDKRIQNLAEKAVWLCNDEAHFLREYGDIDTVSKIKVFIKAIVNFIESCLAVEEAEKIEKRK
ncbi:DUF4145 domain-containing protein [Candidatus Saccharibacteria bacterium]|nr:DUF4145 domain-containing protein [Candidatus Saccharibacteria bacterium]